MTTAAEQYHGNFQGVIDKSLEKYSSAGRDARVEALRLANGCAGYDNDATQTIERAEAYLKFLQGTAT